MTAATVRARASLTVGGPRLFTDGFESGLTTHWSADTP